MSLQRQNLPPEQAAYEIPEIWDKEWFGPIDHQRVKSFAEIIPSEVRSLLDVGCGNGLFLHHLKSIKDLTCERLVGTDRSQTALQHVQTEKYLSSIDCMPFKDKEFDIVTSLEVLEHLPSTIYHASLKEICRVAEKYVLIGVPFNQDIRNSLIECPYCGCRFNVDYHLRSFSEKIITNLFDDHGFHCKKVIFIQPNVILRPLFYKFMILIKSLRRLYDNPDVNKYPGYAVCPACLYENRKNLKVQSRHITYKRNKLRNILSGLLGRLIYRQSYRWIGALYEKRETS